MVTISKNGKVPRMRFNSVDTETIHGYARLLSTPHNTWLSDSFEGCVNPLIKESSRFTGRYFMFNQGFDTRAILKYLPYDTLIELYDENKVKYNQYSIFNIPDKITRIKDLDKKRAISFYDIAQFYQPLSLDKASKKYLGKEKLKNPIVSNIISHQDDWPVSSMEHYFKKNFNVIGKYCKQDAVLTKELAELCSNKITKLSGITLQSFTSKAVLGEKMTLRNPYPKFFAESQPGRYAIESYHGSIFDTWQRGNFDECTDIDISSAFPSDMVNMPHWANGSFHYVANVNELMDNDKWGWVIVKHNCPYFPYNIGANEQWEINFDGKVIQFETDITKIYYPIGPRFDIVTLYGYEFLKKYNYLIAFFDGWVWRQTKDIYDNPFKWMLDVYDEKQKYGKDDYEYSLCKIWMNGTYGKTVQRVGTPRMQNFYYGSYITEMTRINILDLIHRENLQDKVISINADGILFNGDLDFSFLPSKGLGSWDVTHHNSAIIITNGMYQLDDGDKRKTALRGITMDRKYDLRSLMQHKRSKSKIAPLRHKKRPVTLYMGLMYKNIYTPDDINVFKKRCRVLDVHADKTKIWDGINTFGDLLDNQYVGKRFNVNQLIEAKK
jgi:hypothetical protein